MTTDSSSAERPGDGAHLGAGRWAQRGAAGMGMQPGEGLSEPSTGEPPTADDGEPDISPSLAAGHAGATAPDQH